MSHSHPSAFEDDSSKPPEPQLQIVVHAGPLAGKGFPIGGDKVTFGRDLENNISWDDNLVSRRHAQITRRDDQLILEDLGSTNGTLVNGKPIEGQHVLQPADIISIGSSIFGVKGFSAPSTVGITQIAPNRWGQGSAMQAGRLSAPPQPAEPKISPPPSAPIPVQPQRSGMSLLAIMGIGLLIFAVLILAAITAFFLLQDSGTSTAQIPSVTITSPANNSQVQVAQSVTVQATASDPSGVVRIELWVNAAKIAEAVSPSSQGQPTFTASLQWVPTVPGSYTLEIKAYNTQQQVNEPTSVLVSAIAETAETETPTPTPIPETPTPTAPTQPQVTTRTDLNVRAGPGTFYDFVGLLLSDKTAEIIGRDENREWWQIRFEPAPEGVGWITSDPSFSTAINTDNIPIVAIPPTPTGTPTETPIPSATPVPTDTSTPIPATETLTPTVTPTETPEGPQIIFDVSPTVVQGGECVNVSWSVTQVKEVYYQGEGVSGVGGRQECPINTTIYRLRVVQQDGTELVEDRTVEVVNPAASQGTVNLDPNQTINLEDGQIPGDDFRWFVDDSTRRFEALDNVDLAPMGQFSSLNELTQGMCQNANFGVYSFIDGSDVIEDQANALTAGRTACYRTDEGLLGKLRFPSYSTQSLTIEWVTWN